MLESGSGDSLKTLRKAFGPPNNLTAWQAHSRFLEWCANNHEEADKALLAFWSNQKDISEAVREFLNQVPPDSPSGKNTRVNIASFLAMAINSYDYPIYRVTVFNTGYTLTGFTPPDSQASEAAVYQQALYFLDKILDEAKKRGLELRDRLDAQSVLWSMVSTDRYKEVLPEVEHGAFLRYRESDKSPPLTLEGTVADQDFSHNRGITPLTLPPANGGNGARTYALVPKLPAGLTFDPSSRILKGTPTAAQPATTYTYKVTDENDDSATLDFSITVTPETLEALANRLLWDAKHLRTIQRLLQDKGQIVFYGPPGTGKTYVALQLARHFAGAEDSTDLVQFHPSYAYEDFVEGFRPADQNGQPGFQLRDGPLKRIANKARAQPGATHVLVIDEINRGNVARVFGELYFLLEYRDREISLQYSEDPFSLPGNLWFIATMNTADRSIALVDAALRRRFHFVPFFPDQPPVKDLLRRWLAIHKPDLLWVANDILDKANAKLDDRNLAIGPSHFMRPDLDKEWVKLIWDHSILPYIQEQLFGETERLAEFELCKLCPKHFGVDDNGDATS